MDETTASSLGLTLRNRLNSSSKSPFLAAFRVGCLSPIEDTQSAPLVRKRSVIFLRSALLSAPSPIGDRAPGEAVLIWSGHHARARGSDQLFVRVIAGSLDTHAYSYNSRSRAWVWEASGDDQSIMFPLTKDATKTCGEPAMTRFE